MDPHVRPLQARLVSYQWEGNWSRSSEVGFELDPQTQKDSVAAHVGLEENKISRYDDTGHNRRTCQNDARPPTSQRSGATSSQPQSGEGHLQVDQLPHRGLLRSVKHQQQRQGSLLGDIGSGRSSSSSKKHQEGLEVWLSQKRRLNLWVSIWDFFCAVVFRFVNITYNLVFLS